MTDAVQTILDIADGGVKYRTEKMPRVKIKQVSPMPSLTVLGVIAVAFVLIFCVFSIVQLFGMKADIYKLRDQKEEMTKYEEMLEDITETRFSHLSSYEEYAFRK